jgi:hypothetical protein
MILKLISQIFSTVFIVIGLTSFASIPFYLLWLWGKKAAQRENEYEQLYSRIEGYIEMHSIDLVSYKTIMDELIKLGKLKHKNREKTSVLTCRFFTKYATIARQKVKA